MSAASESGIDPSVLAQRLLRPGVLDEGLRSGLFLARPPGDDDWTEWRDEFTRAAERLGAKVLCVDAAEGAVAAEAQLRRALAQAMAPAFGARPGSRHSSREAEPIAAVVSRVISMLDRDLVLLLDNVDRLVNDVTAASLLRALKAARDAVNLAPVGDRRLIIVGAGRDVAPLRVLVMNPEQAFFGANIAQPLNGGARTGSKG